MAELEAFQRAVETGDCRDCSTSSRLVVAMSDGGGVKQAVLRPIVAAALDIVGADLSLEPVQVNGCPATA
jgi:hypothetical protein